MNTNSLAILATLLAIPAFAGEPASGKTPVPPPPPSDPFALARRPITNPTLFDLAIPRTNIHPIFMYQSLPDKVSTTLGELPVGGDFQVYAIQAEYAFNDKLSLVATKDGYIDFNPDATFATDEGFANTAAGLKYVLLARPEAGYAMSGTATVEVPLGDSEVWQGEGDGAINIILNNLKMAGDWQFANSIGARIPFSDGDSTIGFGSAHLSYALTEKFMPLVEVNWFHVLDDESGESRFSNQVGRAVPAVAQFEGGDLVNLGSSHATDNADIVTVAAGFCYILTDSIELGAAFELPLTNDLDNLMEYRITADLVWKC
ncbi:MAG: hypothetical protein ACKO2G_05650 [Verrucomicrobiales bacterium]